MTGPGGIEIKTYQYRIIKRLPPPQRTPENNCHY